MRRDFFMQFTDFHTPSDVSLVPRLRGDDGKEEAGMTVVLGKPTSIVVPVLCRELLIQPTHFLTPSDVSIVPRLRGDDGKEEAGMTVVLNCGDGCIWHGRPLLRKTTSIVVPALCRGLTHLTARS